MLEIYYKNISLGLSEASKPIPDTGDKSAKVWRWGLSYHQFRKQTLIFNWSFGKLKIEILNSQIHYFLLNHGFELGQTEKLISILGCSQSSALDCVDTAERILFNLKQELGMQGTKFKGVYRIGSSRGIVEKWNLQDFKGGNDLFFFSCANSLILNFFKGSVRQCTVVELRM